MAGCSLEAAACVYYTEEDGEGEDEENYYYGCCWDHFVSGFRCALVGRRVVGIGVSR